MEVLQRTPDVRKDDQEPENYILKLAPVFDSDRAAEALSGFLQEARIILEQIEEAYDRAEEARPVEKARRDILRFLAQESRVVEFHELPRPSGVNGRMGRALVDDLAREGYLSLERDGTYPNMVYLQITAEGREELRRVGVREAMSWLHGAGSPVAEAVGGARQALRQLAEAIES